MSQDSRRRFGERPLDDERVQWAVLRHLWYGPSSGLIAGLLVGLCEAVLILAGVNTGEYTALLAAALLYSLCGAGVGCVVGVLLLLLHRLFRTSDHLGWALGFSLVFVGLQWVVLHGLVQRAIYNNHPLDVGVEVALLAGCLLVFGFLTWFGTILVHRTPLKILRQPRGTLAFHGSGIILAAVFSLTPGQGNRVDEHHQPPDLAEHPNVLLIVVDGLRVDRMGLYGGAPDLTPNLDAFAEEAIVFEQAYTGATWVRPALAGLMTSEPAVMHATDRRTARLPDTASTIAEMMAEQTYHTIGVPNDRDVGRAYNFHQGFDRFDYRPAGLFPGESESTQRLTLFALLRRLYIVNGSRQQVGNHYRPTEEILSVVREEIQTSGDQRWFAWVQLKETTPPYFHRPLNGHAEFLPGSRPTNRQLPEIQEAYAAEVRHVDAQIGAFLEWLRETERLEDIAVIITASHGTELLDHGGWGFGETLYDEVLHVPLLIRLPQAAFGGTRAGWQVRLLDVGPTIAHLVNARRPTSWHGRNLLGPGFEAWCSGETSPPRELPVFANTSYQGHEMEALRAEGWKFIRVSEGHPRRLRPEELYRVSSDAKERTSLAGIEGAMQAKMSSRLRQGGERNEDIPPLVEDGPRQ